jgi:cytochrome c-type biogenesis protein CcmE
MNPTRRNRLLWIGALVVAAAIAAAMITYAIQRNVTYLYTPSEVLRGEIPMKAGAANPRFRLGGMVAANSFQRAQGSLEAHFRVTDGDAEMPVVYTGILPDLFREKQAVIATGRMQGDHFVAEQVLAKHDETYMPKEVADKMGAAHRKHDVQAPDVGAKQ